MPNTQVTITILDVGDELELAVNDIGDVQRGRRHVHKVGIKAEKKNRPLATRKEPDIFGPHLPIIVSRLPGAGDEDIVRFECAQPFAVDVDVDDGYGPPAAPPPNTPRNPFVGLSLPRPSQLAGATNFLELQLDKTLPKANNAKAQKFYKFTVWAFDKKLDPDIICEF